MSAIQLDALHCIRGWLHPQLFINIFSFRNATLQPKVCGCDDEEELGGATDYRTCLLHSTQTYGEKKWGKTARQRWSKTKWNEDPLKEWLLLAKRRKKNFFWEKSEFMNFVFGRSLVSSVHAENCKCGQSRLNSAFEYNGKRNESGGTLHNAHTNKLQWREPVLRIWAKSNRIAW